MNYRAIFWDVDGTLAETERDGHRVAFNKVFQQNNLDWHWDEKTYGRLLKITGGKERMAAFARERGEEVQQSLINSMHQKKNEEYALLMEMGAIKFRPEVGNWIEGAARYHLTQGVVTTTSRANLNALMNANLGEDWQQYFSVIICGEDVADKKPHPEAYDQALHSLKLDASKALAIEDSPNGLASALAAKIDCLITKGEYFKSANFEGAHFIKEQLPPLEAFWGRATVDKVNKKQNDLRLNRKL